MATIPYEEVVKRIGGETGGKRPMTTTACYLCFCNGKETTVIEKDRISAKVRSSKEFIVVTNADDNSVTHTSTDKQNTSTPEEIDLKEILEEAQDRQQCARNNWVNMRVAKARSNGLAILSDDDLKTLADLDDVVEMVQKYPTTNECTHFACVMEPTLGSIRWCRRWMEPVSAKWIRAHMSETW